VGVCLFFALKLGWLSTPLDQRMSWLPHMGSRYIEPGFRLSPAHDLNFYLGNS
jgi:hypothetical protein